MFGAFHHALSETSVYQRDKSTGNLFDISSSYGTQLWLTENKTQGYSLGVIHKDG